MDAPVQVKRAVALLWVSLGLSAVEILTSVVLLETELPEWHQGIVAISVAIWLGVAALIYLISQRRNWARITYLVLVVLTIAGHLTFPFSVEPWWSTALLASIAACDVVALYWLFSGVGAQWYSSQVPA